MRYILAFLCSLCVSYAQTRILGEITSKTAGQISVKTNSNETVNVPVDEKTSIVKVPPGETSLSKATPVKLDELAAGDRVLIRNNQIIVMSRSDLASQEAAQRADWQKRGVAGKVVSAEGSTISIKTQPGQTFKIATNAKTTFRRYAPDSVRFSDAKPGELSDIKSGDQVRVLGNTIGDIIEAETVVSGSFRNIAGTVISIDTETGEIRLKDLVTKKTLIIRVSGDITARRLPPAMAEMMARRLSVGGPANSTTASGGMPPRDIGQMLERMPMLNIKELKAGDALIVAGTSGQDDSRSTAIAVLAGVEPLLTGPATDRRLTGAWNFDINIAP